MFSIECLSAAQPHSWVPPVLSGIFFIHTIAFIVLYIKRRHRYVIMLIVAFPLLMTYYLLKTFHVSFPGMDWIRWCGIILATIPVILAIKERLTKKSSEKNT